MSDRKTYEEHRAYLHEICRLQLWFAWHWLRGHPGETLPEVLRNRIDIYRKTDINQGTMNPGKPDFENPAWSELESRLTVAHSGTRDDPEAFEEEAFRIVQPTVDARSQRDYEERPYVLDYQCGSLKYDPPRDEHPGRVSIHIANAVAPRSIFNDPAYMPTCLREVMAQSAAEYGADSLGTHTWLNSHPRWLELFPRSWQDNMGPETREVKWHFGFWGQFINARGTFNTRLGQQLRVTGELPFYPRLSWCTFDALRAHLNGAR